MQAFYTQKGPMIVENHNNGLTHVLLSFLPIIKNGYIDLYIHNPN